MNFENFRIPVDQSLGAMWPYIEADLDRRLPRKMDPLPDTSPVGSPKFDDAVATIAFLRRGQSHKVYCRNPFTFIAEARKISNGEWSAEPCGRSGWIVTRIC